MPIATLTGTTITTDTFLDQGSPTTNSGTATDLYIGESNAASVVYRTLLKFSLASIPPSATINSATLSLWILSDISGNARTLRVYRCLRAWTEAGATWNTYDGTNNWGTAGADNTTTDREASDIGSVALSSSESVDAEKTITLTASSVEEMLTGGSFTNNGFVLKMDTENDDAYRYYSSENADTSKIPKLVIDYTARPNIMEII